MAIEMKPGKNTKRKKIAQKNTAQKNLIQKNTIQRNSERKNISSKKGDTEGAAGSREMRRGQQPQRQRRVQNNPVMKRLEVILGILCGVLVIALIWQNYYDSHTYKKGELAAMAQGGTQQRLKFMTEANTEGSTETLQNTAESSPENASENGADNGSEENTQGAEDSAAVQTAAMPEETAVVDDTTVVESSESYGLKNQLLGILPGIQKPGSTESDLIAQADRMAAMYDYDKASDLLQKSTVYNDSPDMQEAVKGYQAAKSTCQAYPVEQITHVFFHTLIKDAKKAFDGDQYQDGYNQYMVTIDEFNSIIQQMYDNGYVLVTLYDMAPGTDDGQGGKTFSAGNIMLPPGKKPFVLSQDDVCYYHYMDGDGFASKLVVDENGDIRNEYIEDDGSISIGDYDMVPLIDRFLEQHPDFSYRGSKGYVALTGYDGILGYRTDVCYQTRQNLDTYQEIFFQENPNFSEADYQKECEEAKKVAAAIKADGWEFASHTWGHVGLGDGATSLEQFKTDTDKWEERVEPLIGDTDTLIYAFGGDIGGVEDYSGERFEYLKSKGFNYFCGVDSAQYWVQLRSNYVRQARRNIDGYRMYYNPDMLSDLFDVSKAWDPLRPSSVPQI